MDNQLFPGGTYLDDMPQVCTLCGVVLNNAMSLYSHMQLHILSSNLGPQPPDAGLALNPANILDLLSGVSQLGVPSTVPTPMLLPQGLFTPAVSSVPTRHITPTSLDLGLSLQSAPIPHQPVKPKEKKPSKQPSQSSSNQSSTSSRILGNGGSYTSKKHEESKPSHSKLDRGPSKDKHQVSSKFDHLEDSVIGKIPFQRQSSSLSKPVHEPPQHKDVKLFQPFMTTETSSSLSFQPKSSHFLTASGLTSPTTCKSPDNLKEADILNTPQKMNQLPSDLRPDDLTLLTESLNHPPLPGEGIKMGEGLKINKAKSQELLDSLFDKMKETPAPPPKTSSSQSDSLTSKTQFYPSIMEPMNISPKFSKTESEKVVDSRVKTAQQISPFISIPSTTLDGTSTVSNGGPTIQTTPMISPKLDTKITGTVDTPAISTIVEPTSQPVIHPAIYGNAPSTSGIPPVGIAPLRSTSPPVLGHTDPTKNPLGTGFFNALTQKLINPGLPACSDFAKTPSTSAVNFGVDPSTKGYYENGVLLNHDYDKISDTNDEDDLERLIDIDPKEDTNIDSKSIDMIDDLLNEFNERTEDANKGNQNQLFDFLNVLDDGTKGKSDRKSDILSDENAKANISIIDALLEQEKEKIDQELRENAIMQASTSEPSSVSKNAVTTTSSTVTFTSSSSTSTVSSVGFVSNVGVPNASSGSDQNTDKKKEDDHIDFEIPRVGKLMKIRKYFESQEQKKKEQTQVSIKEAAIKIQEKKEPVVEEKPQLQTILVQVSKRKKIEYGPYINKQSLLEGKPKEQEETSQPQSPVKLFRPKPRPQVPTRRTFNLRARRTKTDFASLANKGSKHPDGKKGIDKNKGLSKDSKDTKVKSGDAKDVSGGGNDKGDKEKETDETDSKIVTRNKAANKDVEKSNKVSGKLGICTSIKAKLDKDNKRQALRTRSNRDETLDADKQETEGKSLRHRVIKPAEDTKTKKVKSNETSPAKESDSLNSRKVLRSKLKTTPEKNDIKKCSVNLGENLSGSKLKAASLTTVDIKENKKNLKQDTDNETTLDKESIEVNPDIKEEEIKLENDVKVEEVKDEILENNQSSEITENNEAIKNDETDCIITNTEIKVEKETIIKHEETVQPQADGKSSQTQANIFDVMNNDMDERRERSKSDVQPERKVEVMKLKLGSEIQKSLKEIKESLSLSKKRKFESQKDDLQRELDTCTKKVSEIQRQIASHKEAESLKRQERSNLEGDGMDNADKGSKKKKHSVENEFQRLVDEAVEEAKKSEKADPGKQAGYSNLRKRLNESVKYNDDNFDDEIEISLTAAAVVDPVVSTPKARKITPIASSKITPSRFSPKFAPSGKFRKGLGFNQPVKKDVDVYDFTDTEMSDKEDSSPLKFSSIKPKYVSNVGTLGQKLLTKKSSQESLHGASSLGDIKAGSDDDDDEVTYIGKTVEPLKIKLTKIIPYKEKKHKHKKKKRKKDRERSKVESNDSSDADDDESRDSMDLDSDSAEEGLDTIGANNQASKKSKLKTKNHVCSFCNQAFSQKCDLRKHEMIHTGERPWPCEICDKKFLRKTDLVKHTRTHTGEKPYKCEFCDKRVSDKSQLNVHRRLHTGDRPYQCTQCGKGCITSSELTRHRIVHCTETSHMCKLCKKVFKVKESLGMHMKLHYKSRGKMFKCDKCTLGFDQHMDLERHKCANSLPTLFICSECYMEFTDEMPYVEHIKTHNLNVYSCNICTHIFEDKHSLETHLCSIGMDIQKHLLQCEFCEKGFQDQDSLTKHLPDHDNDVGSFMCESCSQIFTVRKEFIVHSQKHRIGAFICNGCGTGFHDSLSAEAHNEKCTGGRQGVNSASSSQKHSVDGFIKTEPSGIVPKTRRTSGTTRASVISANVNFKSGETMPGNPLSVGGGFYPSTVPSDLDSIVLQSAYVKQETPVSGSKINTLDSNKVFDPSEFCNSPDFSSLTEDPSLALGLNSFQKGKSNKFVSPPNEPSISDGQKINAGKVLGIDMMLQQDSDGRKSKQFQNITSNLQSSHNSAQTDDGQWIGSYQMSANDYVNSLLNKMESGVGTGPPNISVPNKQSIKPENPQFSDTFKFQPSNSRTEFKDNLENQAKADIFSDFDFAVSNQKVPDLYQSVNTVNKHGVNSKFSGGGNSQDRGEYQGVDQTSFISHPRSTFQDKSDFSSFSNSFLNFPQSSSYSLTGSGSLFGGAGQSSSKQSSSNSLFTEDQDLMHNSYFLGVDDSIKGTLPTDKNDDTAALLSNFDYDLN